MSHARRHQLRVLASMAGRDLLATDGREADDGANENRPRASAYELMLVQLAEHNRRLKLIQSLQAKIAFKRQVIDEYAPWVQGVLQGAADADRVGQDDVVATIMVWRIDVGDFEGALPLAEHVLRHKLTLPERYVRQPAVLIAEEVAEAANKTLDQKQPFSLNVLLAIDDLTANHDMPDEVRAKLQKAIGRALVHNADDEANAEAENVAGGRKAMRESALAHLRSALKLHDRVGVKKDIERLERDLNKVATPPAA